MTVLSAKALLSRYRGWLIGGIWLILTLWLIRSLLGYTPWPTLKFDSQTITFVYLGLSNVGDAPSSIRKNTELSDHPFLGLSYEWDRDLAERYAQYQGVQAQFLDLPNMTEINKYLREHPKAIAIGVPQIEKSVDFINLPPYRENRLVVVSLPNRPYPKILAQPSSTPLMPRTTPSQKPYKIALLSNYPHEEMLSQLLSGYPQFRLIIIEGESMNALVRELQEGKVDYAFITRNDWALLSRIQPQWVAHLTVDDNVSIGWRISAKSPPETRQSLMSFFEVSKKNGYLLTLAEQYRPDYDRLDSSDLSFFEIRKKKRLIHYQNYFLQAAQATNQPPALLMALSYQESQWDEAQNSQSGAKGLMMINAPTAEFLRLPEEPSAEQQILAGAQYLKMLREDLSEIAEPDRTLIALAAYNMGPGAMGVLLQRLVSQYTLYNETSATSLVPLPDSFEEHFKTPKGTLIRPKLSPQDWKKITWPRLRHYIIGQSLAGKLSSQSVILAERVRIFQSLLERSATTPSLFALPESL